LAALHVKKVKVVYNVEQLFAALQEAAIAIHNIGVYQLERIHAPLMSIV